MYGEDGTDSVFRCPGEAGCDLWASAYGETFEEKQKNACFGCTRCHGNPPLRPGETPDEDVPDAAVERVEQIYYEQLAGRKICLSDLSPDEWDGLIAFHAEEKQKEREFRANFFAFLKAMMQTRG